MNHAPERVRLWIDTDIGDDPDDAVALAVAARHPNVDLVGVSTVFGDVDARAGEARSLLDALGHGAAVHPGLPAEELLRGVDALLAIGPLTNVARMAAPARFVAMGGALGQVLHRGEQRFVEHNFSSDPDAAAIVVRENPQLLLVPLDVTARLTLTDDETAALVRAVPPLRAPVDEWRAQTHAPLCLHDPFALLALLDDVPVVRRRVRLVVDPDGRVREDDRGVERDVVVETDARAAIGRVLRVTEGTRTPGLRDHNPTL